MLPNIKTWKGCDDFYHRSVGPAYMSYYDDEDTVEYVQWYKHGKLHREDGPAYIGYYRDGSIKWSVWFINDKERDDIAVWLNDLGYDSHYCIDYPDDILMAIKLKFL